MLFWHAPPHWTQSILLQHIEYWEYWLDPYVKLYNSINNKIARVLLYATHSLGDSYTFWGAAHTAGMVCGKMLLVLKSWFLSNQDIPRIHDCKHCMCISKKADQSRQAAPPLLWEARGSSKYKHIFIMVISSYYMMNKCPMWLKKALISDSSSLCPPPNFWAHPPTLLHVFVCVTHVVQCRCFFHFSRPYSLWTAIFGYASSRCGNTNICCQKEKYISSQGLTYRSPSRRAIKTHFHGRV